MNHNGTAEYFGLASIVLLAATLGGSGARANCALPPPGVTPRPDDAPAFTGRLISEDGQGTIGTLFEFEVDSVLRGRVPTRVVADIIVDRPGQGSEDAIGPPPIVGDRYLVVARSASIGTQSRLFVDGCGGSLERLTTASAPSVSPIAEPQRSHAEVVSITAAALALVAAGLFFYFRRHSMRRENVS